MGAYGICIADDKILLVRKARGPYTGLLDLPGGGIEFGEEPETALRREFLEETRIGVKNAVLRSVESKSLKYTAADDRDEELHHVGLIYFVTPLDHESGFDDLKTDPDGQDSSGAEWAEIAAVGPRALTPFAQIAVFGSDNSDEIGFR